MSQSSAKSDLYSKLYKAVKERHADAKAPIWTEKTKVIWDPIKKKSLTEIKAVIDEKVHLLKSQTLNRKSKLMQFFVKPPTPKSKEKSPEAPVSSSSAYDTDSNPADHEISIISEQTSEPAIIEENATPKETSDQSKPKRPCLAQQKVSEEIVELSKQREAIKLSIVSGLCADLSAAKKRARELEDKQNAAVRRKRKLELDAKRAQDCRLRKKRKVAELLEKRPELSTELEVLETRTSVGRPRYENNDCLLATLQEIAIIGSAADDRRNTEMIRSIRTLDDLTAELNKRGFQLKRSAVYLRLAPKRWNTSHGKTHVTTVPVRLIRASNDKRAGNPDRWFAAKNMEHAEELASLLGPEVCVMIGQDDKAHIPIGLTAANKQSPLLMSLKYKVSLPDHDFVIATKHKLTPTVFGLRRINLEPIGKRDCISYSGPTRIQIKSLKHTPSNAMIQFEGLNELLDSEPEFTKSDDGKTKPVMILTRDGHDGPRFPTTRNTLAVLFKERDLDLLLCVCNAAGLSAYHFIERRMAPLSAALSGVVLPHDHFGSHLDNQGKTVDPDLELKNFEKAGKVLSEIFNQLTIDGYAVTASYRDPNTPASSIPIADAQWVENHCLISKYCLQISKCEDRNCCSAPRSNVKELINGQFLPGPLLIKRDKMSLVAAAVGEAPVKNKVVYTSLSQTLAMGNLKPTGYELIGLPYDFYCPSVQEKVKEKGGDRYQCKDPGCKKIFTTLELSKKHIKLSGHSQICVDRQVEEPPITDTVELTEGSDSDNDHGAIIISDIRSFVSSQFEEI